MKKRMICLILALILLLGLMPVSAMAAAPYYENVGALASDGEYVLAIREESSARGGTLFTFTQDGTVSGSWSIKGGPGYLVATRGALNCNSATVTAQASWNITVTDGAFTLQNNTSSKYYLLFSDGAFTINRNAGDPLALYDADGNRLTALPEGPFQAYICNADGNKYLSDAITADDAEKAIITDYVIADRLALEEFGLYGLHTRDVGDAAAWQFRDGKLYSSQSAGLNAALDAAKAPDAANYADGKLQIGGGYLTVADGALAIGTKETAASVQLWKKLDAPTLKGTYLAITCDIHHKFRSDFAVDSQTGEVIGTTESAERLAGWLDKASADFGGVYFDQLISCGDMGDANTAITGANYWNRVVVGMDTVANHEKVLGGGFFINGNHEWANGQYASLKDTNPVAKRVREAGYVEESDDYVIYSLSAAQTNNSFNTADITALDNYLQTAPNKPIFIASHYPLHNFNRTEQRRDDLINVLNKYADSLQIIFLWGHNHTEEDPNYGIVFDGRNIDDSGMDIPHIEFTYCSAGCMTDDEYDAHAVFTKPKGMIACIAPNKTVSLTYYDVNYDVMSTTVLPKPGASEPEADKTALNAAIAEAETIDTDPYTASTAAALKQAIEAARAVRSDENATQADVDAAAGALRDAVANLDDRDAYYAGITAVNDLISSGEKYLAEDYVPESFAALQAALAAAREAKQNVEQEFEGGSLKEVNAAIEAMRDALDALVLKEGGVDRGALIAAIVKAENAELGAFTDASTNAFLAALEQANALCKDAGATQTDVDAAAKTLTDAQDGLEKKSDFRFDDVRDASKFYFEPVYWAYFNDPQITNGVDAAHFGPERGCTRGQVVTFLWRAAGCPEPTKTETGFADVKPGAFYEKAVAWAVENNITNGMNPASFAPDATCTRGQIVTFLWRFKDMPEPEQTNTPFTDVDGKAFYAKAVAWAVENEVTNGMSPTGFAPEATCTRGQIVTFLYRAMQK